MAARRQFTAMRLGGRVNGLTIAERLEQWSIPEPMSGCWLWLGALSTSGYGVLTVRNPNRRVISAHRLSWEVQVGPIPAGLVIDHKCRVRACVNPDHMRTVTHVENTMCGESPVARNARQTHCKNGHPLTRHGNEPRRCAICRPRVRRLLKEAGVECEP